MDSLDGIFGKSAVYRPSIQIDQHRRYREPARQIDRPSMAWTGHQAIQRDGSKQKDPRRLTDRVLVDGELVKDHRYLCYALLASSLTSEYLMNDDRYGKITTVVKLELLYDLSIGVFTFDISLPNLKCQSQCHADFDCKYLANGD